MYNFKSAIADKKGQVSNILVALLLLILLGSLLRLYKLGEHSLWLDEVASVRSLMRLLRISPYEDWGLLGLLKRDRIPPLYPFIMMPFYYLSNREWSMRLTSVIFGIATIPLMYCFGSRLFNKKIGLISALLLTFSPFHIYYSQELRAYSLFLFFSILTFYLSYLALEENKTTYYIGLIVVSVLGMYTHTYTVFPLLIVNLYFILGWKAHRHRLRNWILSHLTMAVLCIPEMFHIVHHIIYIISRTTQLSESPIGLGTIAATAELSESPIGLGTIAATAELSESPIGLRTIAATFYLFTMGRVFFPTRLNLISIVIQGVGFGGGLLLGTWMLLKEKTGESERQRLSFFVAVATTYVVICLVSLSLIPLFDEARIKYLIFFLPFYYLLVARGWDHLSNPAFKTASVSLAVLISLISVYPFYFEWDQVGKGSFRAAAEYVRRNFDENDAIYHVTRQSALPFAYYFDWQVPQIQIGESDPNDASNDRLWLISREERGGLEFSLASRQEEQSNPQEQQSDAASLCNSYINNDRFHLVDLRIFPGKNQLVACLYHTRVSRDTSETALGSGGY